jgi:hypothetical protein
MKETAMTPTFTAQGRRTPPDWATRQRQLLATMEQAAAPFVEHSSHPDGQLIWRSQWTSMDGTDNGYEAFLSFPLFHLLGGSAAADTWGRRAWEAITRQFTDLGTVDRGFVTGFDWFHHSESYTYLYYLAMAAPDDATYRQRARDFAAMYMGEDPLAPNWDKKRRMLRSPLNGSHGPRFVTTTADWDYHRPILATYLAPYEDLPGADATDPLFKADWTDDAVFGRILDQINQRMTRGDVPLNLCSTSMVTHAYLYTGEDKYKNWVLDYITTWIERRDQNGGIIPDNIGPEGQAGELIDGKWWGGYYGWRWPHGARNIIESSLVAGSCALLMTGDPAWLDLCRSQLDLLWEQRRNVDGQIQVPARHGDQGWFDYRPPQPLYYIHLHYLSQSAEDRDRLEQVFPHRDDFAGLPPDWGASKAGICPPQAWYAYIDGTNPNFPAQALDSTYSSLHASLDRLEADDSAPESRECYHFQNLNPVVPEALVQMAMGSPAAIYNGGFLQAHLRYYDPQQRRPGLPEAVAALVERVGPDGADLVLVNTDPLESRSVLLQAGSFGEHRFTKAQMLADDGTQHRLEVNGRYLKVDLGPGAQARLALGMQRFAHKPSYQDPAY